MVDIVVIGAGAAGIAAGRRLAESGADFLIVEAGSRVGGRAWTRGIEGHPLDLGCGWFHSADRNPWVALAEALGAPVDRTRPAWGRQFDDLGFSRDAQRAAARAFAAFDDRLRTRPPESDCARDALDPASEWNDYLEARSGYVNGAGLGALSVADYLAYDNADTDVNWRPPAGYGALVAQAAAGLPIRLGCTASRIDWSGARLAIETSAGTIDARAAIVCVPTSVLAREALVFNPALPDKHGAAAALPLGLANKLFLYLEGADELPPDCHLIGNPHRAATGSYYLRPFGRPMIEAFFGGVGAEGLEAAGPEATIDFAREELSELFGSSFGRRLRPLALSAWREAAGIYGSYSHACPGSAGMRARLAEPVAGRIFFAGEACSAHDFSTAHGAYETGVAAADTAR